VGDGGGGHWLVRMEWRPAKWSVCLPLLIFPYTIKSRSSLLAPAHPGGPGKRAIKQLWWWWYEICCTWLAENTECNKSTKIHHLCTITQLCRALSSQLRHISTIRNKSSAVAEMGDHGHNRHGSKRGRGCYAPFVEAGTPSNTMWPGPRPTPCQVPS